MTDYTTWKVGDRVVCVDDEKVTKRHQITKGKVYCIRGIAKCPITGEVGVYLLGVTNTIHPIAGIESGYKISRFRRVVPRKTDISVFTAMLNKTGVDA